MIVLLLSGPGPICASAAPAGVSVTIVSHATAMGPVVRLADCVRLGGPVPGGLASVAIAGAPAPGQQEVLTRPQIEAVLTGAGLHPMYVSGAAVCTVTTPAATISPDMLVGVATAALEGALPSPAAGSAYVITPMAAPGAAVVPARPYTLTPSVPPTVGLGIVTVGIRIVQDGSLLQTIQIPLRVELRGPVLIAVESLPYHAEITPQSVRVETRTIAAPWGRPLQDLHSIAGSWATQTVPAGTVLTDQMVAQMPAVQRGALVTVVVHRATLWIGATGLAQADGVVGQVIPVKIQDTGVIVSGRVTGSGTVEVGAE